MDDPKVYGDTFDLMTSQDALERKKPILSDSLVISTLITQTEMNDICRKSAGDDAGLDRASQRLGHTSRQTTERFYIRTPGKVAPLR
jgi:hypothetical protein